MTAAQTRSPLKENKSGSPQSGGPVFLAIGKLQRTHGVKGEMVMDLLTDFPERIKTGNRVFVGKNYREVILVSLRPNGPKLLVAFEGFADCDQAAVLRNQLVYIKIEDANTLPEGEFYHHEVLGMEVLDDSQNLVGKVVEIISTGANDVYVITTEEGGEVLIPAIKSVILSVERERKRMIVRLPEWE
jgi:16S rRNA processing protein RimM